MPLEGPRFLSTGDLARKTGTTPRAIRFYEESGLISPQARGSGARRRYTPQDLERLQLIHDLRDLDLSLEDIKQLLEIRDACKSAPELGTRLGAVVSEQLEKTQRRLQALRRLREDLAATLSVVKECVTCTRALSLHPCGACDNITRPETPRILKVLLGQCRRQEEAEPRLVKLRCEAAAPEDDPACEP